MVKIFLDKDAFERMSAMFLNKFYSRELESMLATYAHPEPMSKLRDELDWMEEREARARLKHYDSVYNNLVSVLAIIHETSGWAMVREDLLRESEKKLVKQIADYYLPNLEWRYQIHLLISATRVLKKALAPDNPDREINAKNLAEFLNTYDCKDNKRKKYKIQFDPKKLLDVVEKGMNFEEMRERNADKVQKRVRT